MIRASRGNQHSSKVILKQGERQWENNTKRFAAFQGFAPMRQGEAVNIHESKLSDIHRPTLSRLPIGRLKSYKYKKSAYGGKKSPARAGKKEISP